MKTQKTRTLRVVENNGSLALVIREQAGRQIPKIDAYFLTPTSGGATFAKHDTTRYEVTPDACTCPGHKHYGHKTICKHRAALTKLVALGKIKIVDVPK